MKAEISVIIPVFNAGKFLARCLDSVLAQTFTNIEIICVNDGSTDDSAKILDEYFARDERIKIITKKNAGVSAARNDGIDAAIGKYIHFIDADDFIDLDYYEKMFSAAEFIRADMSCSGFVTDSKYTAGIRYRQSRMLFCMYKKIKHTNALFDSYVWRYLFNRSFINKHKLKFDTSLVAQEDTIFVLTALKLAACVVIVPNTTYHYIYNNASALNSRDPVKRAKINENYQIGRAYRIDFARKNGLIYLWYLRILQKIPYIGHWFKG